MLSVRCVKKVEVKKKALVDPGASSVREFLFPCEVDLNGFGNRSVVVEGGSDRRAGSTHQITIGGRVRAPSASNNLRGRVLRRIYSTKTGVTHQMHNVAQPVCARAKSNLGVNG